MIFMLSKLNSQQSSTRVSARHIHLEKLSLTLIGYVSMKKSPFEIMTTVSVCYMYGGTAILYNADLLSSDDGLVAAAHSLVFYFLSTNYSLRFLHKMINKLTKSSH